STHVTGGTSRCARVMCSAMRRRTPRSGSPPPSSFCPPPPPRPPPPLCRPAPRRAHVVLGDAPLRSGSRNGGEVDAELLRDPPNERSRANSRGRPFCRYGRLPRTRLVAVRLADDDQHRSDRNDLALLDEDARDSPRGR